MVWYGMEWYGLAKHGMYDLHSDLQTFSSSERSKNHKSDTVSQGLVWPSV